MARKNIVTLQHVADRAGVSRSAASFAISGRPGVSADTRSRILRVAAELGYAPNRTAQNLRSSLTGVVAVYIPENVSTMSYYMEATFGIIDRAEVTGHTVTMIPHHGTPRSLNHLNVDGIIILDPSADDPIVTRLLDLGVPVVSGEEMPIPGAEVVAQVISDHAASTREILDRFAEVGSRFPAIITPEEQMPWSIMVESAYLRWCEEHAISPRRETASLTGLQESTRTATRSLLDSGEVDAILALTDGSVLNVVTSAAEYERTIGVDLFVAASVDSPVLQYMDPAVTAVDLQPRLFGQVCMSLLAEALSGEARSAPTSGDGAPGDGAPGDGVPGDGVPGDGERAPGSGAPRADAGVSGGGSRPPGETDARAGTQRPEGSQPPSPGPRNEVVPSRVVHRASTAGRPHRPH